MEVPVSIDYGALDLMAYTKWSAIICPICSSKKDPLYWACLDCYYKWGEAGNRRKEVFPTALGIKFFIRPDPKKETARILSGIKRNLREDPQAAKAFATFIKIQIEEWKKRAKKEGKPTNQLAFFKDTGVSSAWFVGLKNRQQGSLAKAKKIATAFNTTIEEAVAIGLRLIS